MHSNIRNLEKCQKSVKKTKTVEEPKNFSPFRGFPFFHLFFHDKEGLNHC